MRLEINDDDFRSLNPKIFRAAAYFLLHAIGDVPDEDDLARNADGTPVVVPPPAPATLTVTAPTSGELKDGMTVVGAGLPAGSTLNVPPPPPPPAVPPPPPVPVNSGDDESESNVVHGNFPQAGSVPPPPPVSNGTGATTAGTPSPTPLPPAPGAAAASSVVSVEVDSAGMPYDARIHQKAKSKKKDGTWKLIKGIEEKSPGLVQAVTTELAARKGASAPVPLPPGDNRNLAYTVPMPPVANVPAPPGVPAPPASGDSSAVPVPPSPAVGPVGNPSAYRALIDKITDLTRAAKTTPAKVSEICQSHGAPSLMVLNSMQDQKSARDPGLTIIEAVSRDIDAAALGLL